MTEKNIEKLAENASIIISLRTQIDDIINTTWRAINDDENKGKEKMIPYITAYKDVRKALSKAGVHKEDIDDYNDRFKNLPWENCGYKIPQLN
jgi:hypothetical protein